MRRIRANCVEMIEQNQRAAPPISLDASKNVGAARSIDERRVRNSGSIEQFMKELRGGNFIPRRILRVNAKVSLQQPQGLILIRTPLDRFRRRHAGAEHQ